MPQLSPWGRLAFYVVGLLQQTKLYPGSSDQRAAALWLHTHPTPLRGGPVAAGSLLVIGSGSNVKLRSPKFIKGFLLGLEICSRFSIPLNSLLKFNAAIKMMDNKLFQEK